MASPVENTGRLVWMSKAQRDWLDGFVTPGGPGKLLVAAFDAAPNPAEVVRKALAPLQDLALDITNGVNLTGAATRAVLVALGANEPAGDVSANQQQQDADGVWREAIPLPFYGSRWTWRGIVRGKTHRVRSDEFICKCGEAWESEEAYRAHYRSRHLCICPSHASNRDECAVHDDKGRVRGDDA